MDSLLSRPEAAEPLSLYGREAVKEELRHAIGAGGTEPEALLSSARDSLSRRFAPTLVRAVNATGVLLHTNLGRAPLPEPAREAVLRIVSGYSTVEYDAGAGRRGTRQDHVRRAARELFGAEDALAVNNNASAVFLSVGALAHGRSVVVARGELVGIGGRYKIPEMLEGGGARLREVGRALRAPVHLQARQEFLEPAVRVMAGAFVGDPIDSASLVKRRAERRGGRELRFLLHERDAQAGFARHLAVVQGEPAREHA